PGGRERDRGTSRPKSSSRFGAERAFRWESGVSAEMEPRASTEAAPRGKRHRVRTTGFRSHEKGLQLRLQIGNGPARIGRVQGGEVRLRRAGGPAGDHPP